MTNGKILVVDDEAFFRQVYHEMLAEAGYEVLLAASGVEAMEVLAHESVDVVLTDMVMEGLSGIDLLIDIRNLPNAPDVIMITGHATVETAIQALKNGAQGYLLKPANSEELFHTIQSTIEQRKILDENSHLRTQIRLFETGQSLSSILEVDRLMPQMIRSLLGEIGGGRALAVIFRETSHEVLAKEGVDENEAKLILPFVEAEVNRVSGPTLFAGEELAVITAETFDLRQLYLLPLVSGGECRGAVALLNRVGDDIPADISHRNITFLLNQASFGFENSLRFREAKEQTYNDDLTGLYNQSYLHSLLEQETKRCDRYDLNYSIIFVDLDYFKEVNDTYGHLVGSQTLKDVATLMCKGARDSDVFFRYGGDEFCIVLLETGEQGAERVANRINKVIADHTFKSDPDITFRLTATVGYATYPLDGTVASTIIDQADKAMYLGKRQRNVVRSAKDLRG